MEWRHRRRLLALVEDPVGVGRDSLLGGGVEVVGAGVVLVGWRESDGVLCVPVEDEAFSFKIVQLKMKYKDGVKIKRCKIRLILLNQYKTWF